MTADGAQDALVVAARFERDHRADNYARRIAAGEPLDPEAAAIDYQCWVAVAEWLETGRFQSFNGGANPESPTAPVIRWPELEAAAEAALVGIAARTDRLDRDPNARPEDRAAAHLRRARLVIIHRKVQLRRQTIDAINLHARERLIHGRDAA